MDLGDPGDLRNNVGEDRALEWAGRRNHVGGFDQSIRGLCAKACPIGSPYDLGDFHTASDRRCDLRGEGLEVVHDLVLRGEFIIGTSR